MRSSHSCSGQAKRRCALLDPTNLVGSTLTSSAEGRADRKTRVRMSHYPFYPYRHDRDCATRQCRQPRCYGGAGRVPLCTAEECRSKLADFDVRRGQPHRRQLRGKRLKQAVRDNVTRSGDCGVSPIQVEGPRRRGGGAPTLVLMVGCVGLCAVRADEAGAKDWRGRGTELARPGAQ